ncbi:MAG TPA: carboxypeptidase regulatory-like domain-containing protein, partial [Draconibacterium sp.]|nr:carboxypeptidase regulatory-like domain-containing protein [Draconibacterium sp.]
VTFTKVRYIQDIPVAAANSFAYLPEATGANESQFSLEWYHYLLSIYTFGILVFSLHLLTGHLKAIKIIRFSRLKELFGAQVNLTEKDIHPFSFFSRIVLSEKTLKNPDLKMIIDHEMIHVRERHTLDILFAELLFLFQWFNPFAWLIREAMRNNLEYLTDHQVAQNHNAEAYQLAMVGLAHKKGVAPFLTALNGSQLKNRIIMMKKKTENRYSLLKQLVVLPLLAILLMGLSNKEVRTEVVHTTHRIKVVVDGTELPSDHPQLAALDLSKRFNGGDVIDALGLEDKVVANALSLDENTENGGIYYVRTSDYKMGSNPEFERMTNYSLDSATEDKDNIHNAENFINHDISLSGVVTDENANLIEGAEIYNQWGTIVDKTTADGKFRFSPEDDENTFIVVKDGYRSAQIQNNIGKSKQQLLVQLRKTEKSTAEKTVTGRITNEKGEPISNVAVVIKGIPYGTITDASGNYAIKTDENSTLVFSRPGFEKQEVALDGKTEINVVLISDGSSKTDEVKVIGYGRENGESSEKVKIRSIENLEGDPPLYVVDGKEYNDIDWLDPDEIKDIRVQKGEVATTLWGEKGKNGIVRITTKAAVKLDITKALVIVDGKEYDGKFEDIDIDPNNIASIDILKDASSTALYGSKGKDGAILVTTKLVEITSESDLRKFIAKTIRYPLDLQKANAEGISTLGVKINSDGYVTSTKENVDADAVKLDEVVVVGYKATEVGSTILNAQDKFDLETRRVISVLPKLNIDKYKGKTLAVTVKYILQ